MRCNLCKKVTSKEVEGNTKKFTHYYLEFENGLRVRICAEYIPSEKVKDEDKKSRIIASNRANAISLDNMSDLVK